MKVHFVTANTTQQALLDSEVRYILNSFYDIHVRKKKIYIDEINKFNHIIIDSGLFTLMFGSKQSQVLDERFFDRWMNDYVNFINKTPFKNATFVELDVQKKLSVEHAWEYRKELKARINKGTVMNVYHLEDENPDKLIEFSDYIAISIPELRFNVTRREMFDITKYISAKAALKGKKVHLLGCTEYHYLKTFNYCYSCDSTTWQDTFRYGVLPNKVFGNITIEQLRNLTDQKPDAYNDAFWSSFFMLLDYERYADSQN